VFLGNALLTEGYKIAKVITFGQPKMIKADAVNDFISLPLLRVIEHDDPVCSLFPNYAHFGTKVLLLNDANYCNLKDVEHEVSNTMNGSVVWMSHFPFSPKVKLSGEELTDLRLAHHHITYYLRLIKPKVGNGIKPIEVSYDDRKKYLG